MRENDSNLKIIWNIYIYNWNNLILLYLIISVTYIFLYSKSNNIVHIYDKFIFIL